MAVRLNVIMVHSPPPATSAQRLGESVVGELIGLAGIDLALVGPLSSLRESSTDRLTLESIHSDVAVLDWQTAAETMQALHLIGFSGHRSPHRHDSEATPADGVRRIYVFNLNRFEDADEVCNALAGLRASHQVRTFSLGNPSLPEAKQPSPSEESSSTEDPGRPTSERAPIDGFPTAPEPTADHTIDLDGLVDELDRLDP